MQEFLLIPQADGSTAGSVFLPNDGENNLPIQLACQSSISIDGIVGLGFVANFDAEIVPLIEDPSFSSSSPSHTSSSSSSSSEGNGADNVIAI